MPWFYSFKIHIQLFIRKRYFFVVTGAFGKVCVNIYMIKRDLCPVCLENPVAVNYIREGKRYFRSTCASCIRKGKRLKRQPPAWTRTGYRKTERCELCNFKPKIPVQQLFVFHVDGNLKNNSWPNLKTVCANCRIELLSGKVAWQPSPIVPDF